MHTFKKDEQKQEHYFLTCLSQLRLTEGQIPSQQLRVQDGNQP